MLTLLKIRVVVLGSFFFFFPEVAEEMGLFCGR